MQAYLENCITSTIMTRSAGLRAGSGSGKVRVKLRIQKEKWRTNVGKMANILTGLSIMSLQEVAVGQSVDNEQKG